MKKNKYLLLGFIVFIQIAYIGCINFQNPANENMTVGEFITEINKMLETNNLDKADFSFEKLFRKITQTPAGITERKNLFGKYYQLLGSYYLITNDTNEKCWKALYNSYLFSACKDYQNLVLYGLKMKKYEALSDILKFWQISNNVNDLSNDLSTLFDINYDDFLNIPEAQEYKTTREYRSLVDSFKNQSSGIIPRNKEDFMLYLPSGENYFPMAGILGFIGLNSFWFFKNGYWESNGVMNGFSFGSWETDETNRFLKVELIGRLELDTKKARNSEGDAYSRKREMVKGSMNFAVFENGKWESLFNNFNVNLINQTDSIPFNNIRLGMRIDISEDNKSYVEGAMFPSTGKETIPEFIGNIHSEILDRKIEKKYIDIISSSLFLSDTDINAYHPSKLIDNNNLSAWFASPEDNTPYIIFDFGYGIRIDIIEIYPGMLHASNKEDKNPIKKISIQIDDGEVKEYYLALEDTYKKISIGKNLNIKKLKISILERFDQMEDPLMGISEIKLFLDGEEIPLITDQGSKDNLPIVK